MPRTSFKLSTTIHLAQWFQPFSAYVFWSSHLQSQKLDKFTGELCSSSSTAQEFHKCSIHFIANYAKFIGFLTPSRRSVSNSSACRWPKNRRPQKSWAEFLDCCWMRQVFLFASRSSANWCQYCKLIVASALTLRIYHDLPIGVAKQSLQLTDCRTNWSDWLHPSLWMMLWHWLWRVVLSCTHIQRTSSRQRLCLWRCFHPRWQMIVFT